VLAVVAEKHRIVFEKAEIIEGSYYFTSFYKLPKKENSFLHCHDVLELGVCLSGSGKLLCDDGELSYKEGDVQFILPYQAHYNVTDEENTLWMFINLDVMKISAPHLNIDAAYFIDLVQKAGVSGIFSKEEFPLINGLITEIAGLFAKEYSPEADGVLFLAKLVELFVAVSKVLKKERAARADFERSQAILPAIYCVFNAVNGGVCPSPADMANACFMSESYFRKKFVAIMGEPPKHYITRIQLQRAQSLLVTTKEPIIKIAALCGFEDNSVFYRSFMKKYGESPQSYRKRISGLSESIPLR
jgi:AraC-like DNA-binding protein/quercetin dioxygenase-like cupin family protein